MPRSYSMDFRLKVVTAALTETVTQREIAQRFNISEATVHNWIKRHMQHKANEPDVGEPVVDPMPDIRKRLQELEQENLVLRQVAQYLTDGVPPKVMYPLVREMATALTKQRVPVVVACRILGFSPQAYYQWRRNPLSERERTNMDIVAAMRAIKSQVPEAGYRRVNEELRRQGVHISDRRAWRLYSEHDLWREMDQPADKISRELNASPQCSLLVLHDSPRVATHTAGADQSRPGSALEVAFVIDPISLRIWGVGVARASASAAVAQALNQACDDMLPDALTIYAANPNWVEHPHVVKTLAHFDVGVRPLSDVEDAAHHTGKSIQRAVRAGLQRTQLIRVDRIRAGLWQWVGDIYHQTRNEKYLRGLTPLEYEAIVPARTQVGA